MAPGASRRPRADPGRGRAPRRGAALGRRAHVGAVRLEDDTRRRSQSVTSRRATVPDTTGRIVSASCRCASLFVVWKNRAATSRPLSQLSPTAQRSTIRAWEGDCFATPAQRSRGIGLRTDPEATHRDGEAGDDEADNDRHDNRSVRNCVRCADDPAETRRRCGRAEEREPRHRLSSPETCAVSGPPFCQHHCDVERHRNVDRAASSARPSSVLCSRNGQCGK